MRMTIGPTLQTSLNFLKVLIQTFYTFILCEKALKHSGTAEHRKAPATRAAMANINGIVLGKKVGFL